MAAKKNANASAVKKMGGEERFGKELEERFESYVNEELIVYSDVNAIAKVDIDVVASKIAVEVTFALSELVEEMNVYGSEFRMGMHRLARWVLGVLFKSPERCVVVPDAIPGFTAMGFKRDVGNLSSSHSGGVLDMPGTERQAATLILERVLAAQSEQVIVIESRDLLLMLFPAGDMRANLRKLGYLFSE